jgi:hypothetical protein
MRRSSPMAKTAVVETRRNRRSRFRAEQQRTRLRGQIDRNVVEIHEAANRATFARLRIGEVESRSEELREQYQDEATLDMSKKAFYVSLMLYPLAVVGLDVLMLGAFTEHMLSLRFDPESLMVPVGTVGIPLSIAFIEMVLAKGIQYGRELASEYERRAPLYATWVLGVFFAAAMPAFVVGLYYTRISVAGDAIPFESQMGILIGLVLLSTAIHIFPLFMAEAVSDAAAYVWYALGQFRRGRQIRKAKAASNRAAARAEAAYRSASGLVERYNQSYPDDPIEKIPLSKAAADLINSVQEGTIRYDAEAPPAGGEGAARNARAEQTAEPAPAAPPEPAYDTSTPTDAKVKPAYAGGAAYSASGNGNGNNGGGDEATYWRDLIEADVKNNDGEVS